MIPTPEAFVHLPLDEDVLMGDHPAQPLFIPDPNAPKMLYKNSYAMTISRPMALDFGLVDPTPEEAEERAASLAAFKVRCAEAEVIYRKARAALDEFTAPLKRGLLDLHAPTEGPNPTCQGCDFGGTDGEAPEWPCRTVTLIAEQHHIALPDHHLLCYIERPAS